MRESRHANAAQHGAMLAAEPAAQHGKNTYTEFG